MYALVGVADGVARHRQLLVGGLCAVGNERADGESDVDGFWCGTLDAHSNDLVGMRGEVFSAVGDAATRVAVAAQRAVEVELSAVVRRRPLVEIIDAQGAQRLVELRVVSLDMVLERVGEGVVLVEERLADCRNPLVSRAVDAEVYGLAGPEGDVVEVDDVAVGRSVDECSELAVADGQRLLEEAGRSVVPQAHGRLLRVSGNRQGGQGKGGDESVHR